MNRRSFPCGACQRRGWSPPKKKDDWPDACPKCAGAGIVTASRIVLLAKVSRSSAYRFIDMVGGLRAELSKRSKVLVRIGKIFPIAENA